MSTVHACRYLAGLPLTRAAADAEAGLCLVSLPLPEGAPAALSLGGRATFIQSLGAWPERPSAPRRLIMACDGGECPPELPVTPGASAALGAPPSCEMRLIEESPDFFIPWESHALRIEWQGRWVELALGLRTGREVHWWEATRLVVRQETPLCRVVEVGGAIPLIRMKPENMGGGFSNALLHKHNWLNGHLFARLHANGVCEVFAHHVNAKYVDDGLPLKPAVPVIGIRAAALPEGEGLFDGSVTELRCGEVRFDLRDAARLATPEKPGNFTRRGGLLVWQPYRGVELHAGPPAGIITGDEYICRAEDEVIPRGVARTVRFSLSLNPDRSPRVARYLAPAWWYGACAEFMATPLLPVSNEYDSVYRAAVEWREAFSVQAGFDDGSMARGQSRGKDNRFEPGWEGEAPWTQLLYAWRTGDPAEHDRALRACYFFTDVCIDHAAKMVRMHAFPPNAFALPMARVHACVGAWLETGDPFPLLSARAVIDTAFAVHKNSWPRMAVGRDACFTRGAVLLYRYLGDEHYRAIARDALGDTAASQYPEGCFGDQGGGSGIHQWGGYIVKPWMGFMAVGGMLDYLELFPEDAELLACVRRFGEWLLRERGPHGAAQGWGYQHLFRGGRKFHCFYSDKWLQLPSPDPWHQEYLARFMLFCALRFNRREYFEAWEESWRANGGRVAGDHSFAQSLQFIPWMQAHLWQARVTESGVAAAPVWLGPRTPTRARLSAPGGCVELEWRVAGGEPAGAEAAPAGGVSFGPVRRIAAGT